MFFKLKDFNFSKKRVLVRVDFNVPISNGKIGDDSRIRNSLPTIEYVLKQGADQIILISHFGNPKNKNDTEYSLLPVCNRLEQLLRRKVELVNDFNVGKNKIIMLENLRFYKGETENDYEFAKKLADLADLFVFDAFGVAHREHASISAIQKYLPSCAGLLLQKEISFLGEDMKTPKRPFVAIIGGAKPDKINVIGNLIGKVDTLIIAGILANTFLKAKGHDIGSSKYNKESINAARKLISSFSKKIVLPEDFVLGEKFTENTKTKIAYLDDKLNGWMIMDIGIETIKTFKEILNKAKTVVWAGPIGVFEFEKFRHGSLEIATHLAKLNITKIIGGGDSGEAIESFGLTSKMTHVSTGGGASLELLAGHSLPGIKALENNYKKFKK